MKPTKEQEQKFWQGYGFEKQILPSVSYNRPDGYYWLYPNKSFSNVLPKIDLNNLFKYAVPKLAKLGYDDIGLIYSGYDQQYYAKSFRGRIGYTHKDKDPAIALFWALDKATEAE